MENVSFFKVMKDEYEKINNKMLEINKLYNMNCLDGLKRIADNSIDLIITDPPYNFEILGGCFKSSNPSTNRNYLSDLVDLNCADFNPDEYFDEWLRVSKENKIVVFCNKFLIDKYIALGRKHNLIWDVHIIVKNNPPPFKNKQFLNDIEYIIVYREKGSYFNDKIDYDNFRKAYKTNCKANNLHPAQKDVRLILKYINIFTKEDDVVLDCFMGSSTTAIACIQSKRQWIGFENDKKYFEISIKRITEEQKIKRLPF